VWGGSASLHRALVDGVGVLIIHTGKRRRFVCISIFFDGGGVYVGVCVNIRRHAYTHTTSGVLRVECEPRGWDETLGGPEESRWT